MPFKLFLTLKTKLGVYKAQLFISAQCRTGKEVFVNMAAAVGRLLSFSKNAKLLASPLRLSAGFASHNSVQTSSTGEVITHTGQVSFD